MGKWRPSGKLIIGGTAFDTDAPIVNFREGPGWDGTKEVVIPTQTDPNPFAKAKELSPGHWTPYPESGHNFSRRYQSRPALRSYDQKHEIAPYSAAKQVIRQFLLHHDGCANADMCFNVVHNERGLSVHFICDNDGTIFQTLDLALEGWHGSELNAWSIGVEMCNRGDALRDPHYYDRNGGRPIKPCEINGHTIKAYDFTPAQYESMKRLSRALVRLLPNIAVEYPQSSPGVQSWGTVPRADILRFNGFLGHYHLSSTKWDPGPFDFKSFLQGIRGAFCFPLFPSKPKPDKSGITPSQPVVPDDASMVREEAEKLNALNESQADGGFYPVGPWGGARLWHGGIHLAAPKNNPVFAPFPGRLVAARMGAPSPIGSVNFVLLRHAMSLSERKLEFYSLYMHLQNELEKSESDAPEWMKKARKANADLRSGQIWLLDEPIEAGAAIGHVGVVGPGALSKSQVHIELFSNYDLFDGMLGSPWETIDGTSGGRFCNSQRILGIIDTNSDGMLSRDELKQFYTSGGAAQMYFIVARFVSEWTAEPSWVEALRLPKDFRDLKPGAIEQLVADQITPGLWWNERVAAHCKLPPDGVVYHYHPISFVRWLNEKLIDAAAQAGPRTVNLADAKEVPPGITDDREGQNMISKNVGKVDECNDKLTLKELVMGYDAPECD